MTLTDDIDISRGDMLVRENNKPAMMQDVDVMICWMNEKKMMLGGKYTIKHTSQTARCIIKEVKYKMDISARRCHSPPVSTLTFGCDTAEDTGSDISELLYPCVLK